MRLKLIVNPTAGRGRAGRWMEKALPYLQERGAEVSVSESRSREHLIELGAEASRDDWDRVVACGGDGTLNLMIREMDLRRNVVGILPFGSGDDFARLLGIPRDLELACEMLFTERVREVDVALANGIRYLGVAGLGFDSEVARYANQNVRFLNGSAVYLYSIFRVIGRFRPHRVTLTLDGSESQEEIMFAAVGNSERYGGGIRIVPTARIDDRKLDLCLVRKCSKWQLLRTLPLAYSGKHVRRPYVTLKRGDRFEFVSEREMEVFADGEPVTFTPLVIELAEERLRIAAP